MPTDPEPLSARAPDTRPDALAAAERMYLAIGAVTAGDRFLSEEYILAYVELGDALRALATPEPVPGAEGLRPEIVVLCGSTRFYDDFQQANYDLTMAGRIVLSVGFYPHAKAQHGHGEGVGHDSAEKVALDELHKRKIDLADRVYVLNRDGYIGSSTRSEIEYATDHGKPVSYAFDRDGVRSTIDGWPCFDHDETLAHVGHHGCSKYADLAGRRCNGPHLADQTPAALAAPDTLDEERLAQALMVTGVLGDAQAASHIYAKAIAKAYAEDAG